MIWARLVSPTADSRLEEAVPELSPLKVKDLHVFNTKDPEDVLRLIIAMAEAIQASSGLIFNSFKELESTKLPNVAGTSPSATSDSLPRRPVRGQDQHHHPLHVRQVRRSPNPVSLSHCLFSFARAISRCFLSDTRSPDAVAFNALISGLASFRRPRPAIALLDELRLRGFCPDAYTFSSLVKACGSVWENEIVHGVCLKYGFSASAYVVSGLVENYAGGGQVGAAEKCFEDCEGVDNVVWVAVVSGYVWNGEFDSAKELFVEQNI
ncbi:hypothetical protein NL676_004195 [Syzygium grande]|nr:hypothetical protein NL676_004195 [Syzygium grande]